MTLTLEKPPIAEAEITPVERVEKQAYASLDDMSDQELIDAIHRYGKELEDINKDNYLEYQAKFDILKTLMKALDTRNN